MANAHGAIFRHLCLYCIYIEWNPLNWQPLGPVEVSLLEGWPHFKGPDKRGSTAPAPTPLGTHPPCVCASMVTLGNLAHTAMRSKYSSSVKVRSKLFLSSEERLISRSMEVIFRYYISNRSHHVNSHMTGLKLTFFVLKCVRSAWLR